MGTTVTKDLPPLPPSIRERAATFHAICAEGLDRYVHGFEMDANRHAIKHGAMDETRMHNDMSRILLVQLRSGDIREFNDEVVVGMLAEAIIRGIAKKREGKG